MAEMADSCEPKVFLNVCLHPIYISKGNEKIEKLLLKYGATPLVGVRKQKVLNKKLIDVSHFIDLEGLQRLLTAGADINTRGSNNMTALMNTAEKGNYEMTKILLENGAAADLKDDNGESALFKASLQGYDEIENLLLKHGVTPLNENENKKVKDEQEKILRPVCNWTKTRRFVSSEALKILERILRAGADINTKGSKGRTCLMKAAFDGNYAMTKILLENKAAIDIKDENGNSALFYAASKGNEKIEKLLLNYGATPLVGVRKQKVLNKKLINVSHFKKDFIDLEELQRLLTAGADINTRDSNNMTALIHTVKMNKNNYEPTKLLLQNNASVDLKDNDGKTALDWAKGFNKIEKLLLDYGASSS